MVCEKTQKGLEVIPEFGPLGEDVFNRTYAREKPEGGKETWEECIDRVVNGNINFLKDWPAPKPTEEEKVALRDNLLYMKILAAGRHYWATGIDEGSQFIDNCFMVGHWNRNDISDHFCFTFMRLMEGGGVGTNYSCRFIECLPELKHEVRPIIICDEIHKDWKKKHTLAVEHKTLLELPIPKAGLYDLCNHEFDKWHNEGAVMVEDSRQGWADALKAVMCSAVTGEQVVLNLTSIRPYGAKIRGFGGTASGPYFLALMLRSVAAIMNDCIKRSFILTSRDCNAIDHQIAVAVVSGNVRRSARIGVKHWKDPDIMEFLSCKEGNMALWTANISLEIDKEFLEDLDDTESLASKLYRECVRRAHKNGEPGFWNSELCQFGRLDPLHILPSDEIVKEREEVVAPNPCGEIAGQDLCCLGQVNLANCKSPEEAFLAAAYLTRFLIRATFSKKPDPRLQAQVLRNRRIGVGVTGLHNWLVRNNLPYKYSMELETFLDKLYAIIRKTARAYAFELGIPEPVKVTAVAPCGTISLLPGVSQGIHPVYALWFLRRVLYSEGDPAQASLIKKAKEAGHHVEDSVYTSGTKCVSYLCEDPIAGQGEVLDAHDIALSDMLEMQALFQENFADNAVSFTANFDNVKISEKELGETLMRYLPRVKGVTVMPFVHDRPQAPYQRLTKAEHDKLVKKRRVVVAFNSETECPNGACPIV